MEYFVVGQVVRLTHTVYDAAGALTTPATATLVITQPDGTLVTVTSPTVVSVGLLRYDFTSTQAGRHTYRWDTTSPVAPDDGSFDVAATTVGIISLADGKAHLNKSGLDVSDDEELRPWIEAITRSIQDYTGKTIIRTPGLVTRRMDTHLTTTLYTNHRPLIALTSITSLDGATTWSTSATDVDVDLETGCLTALTTAWYGRLKMTYTAGMAVVLPNYRQAALYELHAHWRTQQQSGIAPPTPFDTESASFSAPMTVELSPGARRLLGPRPPMVA